MVGGIEVEKRLSRCLCGGFWFFVVDWRLEYLVRKVVFLRFGFMVFIVLCFFIESFE